MKLALGHFGSGLEVEADDDFIPNEVICFASVDDAKVLAVDVKFGGEAGIITTAAGGDGEGDIFFDTMQG